MWGVVTPCFSVCICLSLYLSLSVSSSSLESCVLFYFILLLSDLEAVTFSVSACVRGLLPWRCADARRRRPFILVGLRGARPRLSRSLDESIICCDGIRRYHVSAWRLHDDAARVHAARPHEPLHNASQVWASERWLVPRRERQALAVPQLRARGDKSHLPRIRRGASGGPHLWCAPRRRARWAGDGPRSGPVAGGAVRHRRLGAPAGGHAHGAHHADDQRH